MPIYVRDITLELDEPEDRLVEKVARRLKVGPAAIRAYAVVRRSLDARHRDEIRFVHCLEVALDDSVPDENRLVTRLNRADVSLLEPAFLSDPAPGCVPMRHRPIVVGFGPAGMFAALRLARRGYIHTGWRGHLVPKAQE